MTSRRILKTSLECLIVACGVAAIPAAALAQECAQNSDCPAGFSCVVTGASGCAAAPCDPDGNCPEPEPCETMEYRQCMPGPCMSDADCADGMVCTEHTEGECSSGASPPMCPEGADCLIAPPDPVCTERTVTQCAPKWALPCAADADCGAGFTCVEEIEYWCNGGSTEPDPGSSTGTGGGSVGGSGGSVSVGGTAGAGFAPPPPPDDSDPAPDRVLPPEGECGSTPTGRFHCQAQEIPCEANAECPTDWLCKEFGGTSWDCGDTPVSSGGAAGGGGLPNGGAPQPDCDPIAQPETQKLCVPPYYDLFPGRDTPGYGGGTSGGGGSGGEGSGSGPISQDPGEEAPEPPDSDPSGVPTNPPANPADPNDDTAGNAVNGRDADGGGCQMGHGTSTSSSASALLFAMLGLVGFARRRRNA